MTEGPEPTNYVRNGAEALTPEQERTWALTAHAVAGAAMVLSAGTLGLVAALVIYLVYKDRGPFVRQHAADAVNIQINGLIWFGIGWILALILIGFVVLFAVPFVAGILHAVGAVKAHDGEYHWSPLTIRFVH
jgi:uncharacterized Tic20 family protein